MRVFSCLGAVIFTLASCATEDRPRRPLTVVDAALPPDSQIPRLDARSDVQAADSRTTLPDTGTPPADTRAGGNDLADGQPVPPDAAPRNDADTDVTAMDTSPGEPLPPPPGCVEYPNAIACEDFEQADLPTGWTKEVASSGRGNIAISNEKFLQGTRSLRVTMPVGANSGAYISKPISPAGNRFFGRVYFLLPQILNSGQMNGEPGFPGHRHDESFRVTGPLDYRGTFDPESGFSMSFDALNRRFGARFGTDWFRGKIHGGLTSTSKSKVIPIGQWQCLEWEFDGRQPSNVRLWVDNEPTPSINVEGGITFQSIMKRPEEAIYDGMFFDWKAPEFRKFYLGFRSVQPATGETYVYFDSLVLALQRVGCSAP